MPLNVTSISEFQQIILAYYSRSVRSFPWRTTTDPYKILVSEIMLQQTQTERVIHKYTQWLQTFPSVKEAALASLSDVLNLWSGLGYNRRARFLHEACKTVYYEYNAAFPRTAEALSVLPGVGPYTSCAVSCFAYNNPEVFIETNIRAVFIFYFFPQEQGINDKEILPLIQQTLFTENPRIWYYALMDYGAELKKKIYNPNRKSAHYTKQSKFEGSLRQARGAVLRQLVQHTDGVSLEMILDNEPIEYERLENAAVRLISEGYITKKNDLYFIKND